MNIFQKLFDRISAGGKTKSAESDAAGGWVPMGGGGGSDSINQATLLENNKEWVYVATDKVSRAVSAVRFKVMKYTKNGDDEEVFEGDAVDFLAQPGNRFTGKNFIYLNTAYKELTGNAFWKIDREKGISIRPLLPTGVKPIFKDGILIGYRVVESDGNGIKTTNVLPEDVLHDRYVDPRSPYWGVGKLQKIARWVDTSVYANEFNRLFFVNGAQFGGFIETEEESEARIKLIKAGMLNQHTGVKNAHKWGVLPKGAKATPITATMQDMQFVELDDRYRDKILSGFGVPKTLVGFTTDVNRASAEASEYIFMKHTIKPIVVDFIEWMNEYVMPLLDKTGQLYFAFDEFIPENEDLELRKMQAALGNQPFMSVNEVRARQGLPAITGGDVVFGNPFGAPIGQPEEKKITSRVEHAKRTKRMATSERKENLFDSIASKAVDAIKDVETVAETTDMHAEDHKAFVGRVSDYQKQIAKSIVAFNQQQKKDVMDKLNPIATPTKGIKMSDLFDLDKEVGIMVNFVSPIFGNLMTEEAVREYNAQNFEGTFNPTDANIKKIVERQAMRMAKSYNKTTLVLLKQQINQGITNGEAIADIAKRVSTVYEFADTYRANMTAHTEAFNAANTANKEAYRQSGVVTEIKWYTSSDERVCEFCEPLHDTVIGIEEDFYQKGTTIVGSKGGTMKTDYRGIDTPPLHPNCNCFIRPETISVN